MVFPLCCGNSLRAEQARSNQVKTGRDLTITMYPSQEIRDVVLKRRRTQRGRVSLHPSMAQ